MAPRKKLKSWIDDITNRVGTIDAVTLKGELVKLSVLAEALESGQSAVEADSEIVRLEGAITELKAQVKYVEAQRDDFKRLLDAASAEMEQIKKEREENEPISSIEKRILYFLDRNGQVFEVDVREHVGWKAPDSAQNMIDSLIRDGFLTAKEDFDDIAPSYFLSKKAKAWLARDRAKTFEE